MKKKKHSQVLVRKNSGKHNAKQYFAMIELQSEVKEIIAGIEKFNANQQYLIYQLLVIISGLNRDFFTTAELNIKESEVFRNSTLKFARLWFLICDTMPVFSEFESKPIPKVFSLSSLSKAEHRELMEVFDKVTVYLTQELTAL